MRFAHIADTHIRNLKYHKEYKAVFEALFEKLNKEFPTISQDEKTFLLSMWSLDPRKIDEDCKNIILIIEPSFIKKLPMSKKRLEFIQSLSKNIKNINIVYNEINNLPEGNYIHFEHPSTNHWPGEKRERTWLYPEKKGFFKSYFQYRKSLEKI